MGAPHRRKGTSKKIQTVTILCGGNSEERKISILSGKNVHDSLKKKGIGSKLFIWDGNFESLKKIDDPVCFIALHGSPGENGKVQNYLEKLGIKYTGSKAESCELTYDKIKTKEFFLKIGVKTPKWWEKKPNHYPYMIKPRFGGSSIGTKLCFAKSDCQTSNNDCFYEEYIDGREISISIVEINGNVEMLPILEIIPAGDFYDYNSKYTSNGAKLIAPAALSKSEQTHITKLSLKIYKYMALRDFARIDGIISREEVYFLEVNSIPGMTPMSDLPASAKAGGYSLGEIALQAIKTACRR